MIITCLEFLIPKKMDAITLGPFILIRKKKSQDKALLIHENVHVRQFKSNPFRYISYLWDRKVRLNLEVEAYKAELSYIKDNEPNRYAERRRTIIWALMKDYGLNLSKENIEVYFSED